MLAIEETPFGMMRVMAFENSATVTIVADGRSVATMSADFVPLGGDMVGWWLSRALVVDSGKRGSGIGTFLLDRLKQAIAGVSDTRVLFVSPGGYTNDTERQFRFYLRNGFQPVADEPDLLELRWEPGVYPQGHN